MHAIIHHGLLPRELPSWLCPFFRSVGPGEELGPIDKKEISIHAVFHIFFQ